LIKSISDGGTGSYEGKDGGYPAAPGEQETRATGSRVSGQQGSKTQNRSENETLQNVA